MKEEEAAQRRAEQDAEKLRLTLRFERDLHRQELNEICQQSNITNQRHHIRISEKYKTQLNGSLNVLRGQLEDQLRLNHMNFDNQMKMLQGPVLSADAGGAAIASIVTAQASLSAILAQISSLKSQLHKCKASVASLDMQIKYWEQILQDDKCQMDHLRKTIQELCRKYNKLLDDKVKIQAELDNYNTMLKGEESRLKLANMCERVPKSEKVEEGGTTEAAGRSSSEFETEYKSS